jgi:hypothetical protein
MPPDDGLWFYNDENGPPVTPDPGQPGPQEPIRGAQLWPFSRRALEYANLVAQRQDLRLKSDVVEARGCESSNPAPLGRLGRVLPTGYWEVA